MGQLRIRVTCDVSFDPLPVILIVANALAVHADWHYFPQFRYLFQSSLQFRNQSLALCLCPLTFGDVPCQGLNELMIHVCNRIPAKPSIRSVLAQVTIFKVQSPSATSHDAVLFERAFAVVGMNELEQAPG